MNPNAVAIIGMSGRFPGAATLEDFWHGLASGIEVLTPFSEEELQAAGTPPALYHLPRFVKAGTVLEDVDQFDAGFFGLAPREAEILDPQQRLFLECSWEALENAGYAPQHYPGLVGVYAGVSMNTYYASVLARNLELMAAAGGYQLMLGNDKDFLATRVSYKLNLRGPSLVIQTACSTSLVAVQVAYHSLIKHQCDLALAGGASLLLPQKSGYLYQEGMIFSPDGHCRPFDAQGKGIRAGPGVGIVVLKRLEEALRDGDTIRAVIRGAAINNDGSGKVGYTAPSVDGQAEVVATAQALAGVEPESISYIEAHGTGTPLGDPIEIAALTQVFRAQTDRKQFCAIGSVKSNIGHLDAAAGVAGLIKTVLSLEHQAIPPSLNFSTPNPAIDFADGPFYVNTRLSPWSSQDGPRRAGVSSFGIGGTNAHVVLEEAPVREPADPAVSEQILPLSARSRTALESATRNLGAFLDKHQDANIADVAYTLQCGREAFTNRRVLLGRNREELVAAVTSSDPQRMLTGGQDARPRRAVFMFSGQGSQYLNMGKELYQHDAQFRSHLDECARLLVAYLGRDLRKLMFPAGDANDGDAADRLNQTAMAQPALFATEYALAKMWMDRGVTPAAMIGHSIGEYVAACLSGVISLEDALALVAARGRLMQELPAGSMLSVPLPENEVAALLDGHGSLAAVNAPALCTISGTAEGMGAIETELSRRGVTCRRLLTSHAFHSAMMDPVLQPFRERFRTVRLGPPKIPFLSNRTGTWITEPQATDPDYWVEHLRHTVRFSDGLAQLGGDADYVFLEVGPGNVLGTFAKQSLGVAATARILSSLPHPREAIPSDRFALSTLGRLWLQGVTVDWASLHAATRRRRIPLPTYPFERQRYWVDPALAPAQASGGVILGKRPDISDWFYAPAWKLSAALDLTAPAGKLPEGEWLIFLDDECGVGAAVADRLGSLGARVSTVRTGRDFSEPAPGSYTLDPSNRGHYTQLLEGLEKAGRVPRWVMHLWNVTPGDQRGDTLATVDQGQARGFFSLLFLAQAIGQRGWTEPMQLTVVSSGMQAVLRDDEITDPTKATILGPVTVIPQEFLNLVCRSVDIEPVGAGATGESLVAWLVREATLRGAAEWVAYRAGRRWERTYDALRLEPTTVENLPAPRKGGVYLITGGTGGLGLVFARVLTQTENPVLVLTARKPLPAREAWDEWLGAHQPGDRTTTIIREVRALEAAGARVHVVAADVADEARMRTVISEVTAEFGPVHGVLHAAGTPGGGIIQMKTPAAAATVLDPKVRGTLVLESLFRDVPLDFFILFSSINAVYSGPGAADYCSANAFLDAFAHSRSARGRRVVSINWDPWQEVGMAVNTEVPPEMREARAHSLRNGIAPAEGVDALARVLASGLPQVVVATQDLTLILEFLTRARRSRTETGPRLTDGGPSLASAPVGARHPRPELATAYVAPRNDHERVIASVWSALLGIDDIGIHDNFFDLGGHSLLATRVLARLQDSAGVALPLETVFDAPTVAQMSERISTLRWVTEAPVSSSQSGEREEFEL